MQRDLDLVRKILLALEEHEHGLAPRGFTIEGYSEEQVGFHVYLMDQAGLVEAIETSHTKSDSRTAMPRSITWSGYEFLEAARSEKVWALGKERILKAGVGFSLEVLKEVLGTVGRELLGLR